MKSSILFPLLANAVTAAKGIHLRQPNVELKLGESPNVFQSVVDVLGQCQEETAALANCFGGYDIMLTCADCAWTKVLGDMNQGCIDINAIASAEYQSCIDTPTSKCSDECMEEVNATWDCAKAMYCDLPTDSFEEVGITIDPFEEGTCFSLDSNVVVKGKGTIPITDLVIGDMVLSDDKGSYSMVYTKGHYSKNSPLTFLQIFTETSTKRPLEVTRNHLVYKSAEVLPVPAHSIKVGDVVKTIDGPSKVTVIKKVRKNGFFSPYTMSGSIVVDGVVASNFVELSGFEGQESGWFYIMNTKLIHWHTLIHFALSPHRMVCGKLMSCNEELDEDGYVPYASYLARLHNVSAEKQSAFFTVAALLFLVVQCSLFALIESLLQHAFICMFVIIGITAGKWFSIKKANVNTKAKVV